MSSNITPLKKARIASGLTQRRMAELTGFSIKAIENWDQGLTTPKPWVEKQLLKWLKEVEEEETLNECKDIASVLAILQEKREKLMNEVEEIDTRIAALNTGN